jgi:hypothetical protein
MSENHLDPYKLLGVTINSTLQDLKKNYYKLALICHPDKGGDKNDMIILHNAYLYIRKQLEYAKNNKVVENIEYNFDSFLKNNKENIPSYNEIWKNTEECKQLQKFNNDFDKQKHIGNDMIFHQGYGGLMESSQITFDEEIFKICSQLFDSKKIIKHIMNYITCVKNEFKTNLIIYKEPIGCNSDYGSNKRIDVSNITDFSNINNNLQMYDYKNAFNINKINNINNSTLTLEQLLEERNKKFY